MAWEPLERLHPARFPPPRPVANVRVEEDLAFVRRYHLADRELHIRALVASLTARPDARTRAQLRERLQPFREFHEEHPFVTALPHILTGPIILGRQSADDRSIGLTTSDINLHGTIVGPSGSGKTTILLAIARCLLSLRILLGVIDVKEDFGWLLCDPDVLLIDEHTRWNFLEQPGFLTEAEHRAEVIDLLLTRLYGAELQRQLLDAGWQRAAAETPSFSLHDLADAIAAGGGKEPPSHVEARRSCVARLRRFAHYALFTTREDGIPWETLLHRTFVVRASGFDDLARFQFDLLTRYAYLKNRAARTTTLQRVLIIDESYEVVSDAQNGIRSIEPLSRLKQLAREFGIGILTTTVTLRGISNLAQASTHFHLALPPNNQEDARILIRVLGLPTDEAAYFLHRMRHGEALLRIGSWPDVIHLQIPPNSERKHATTDEIASARARTNQFARSQDSVTARTAAAREGETGWTPLRAATARREQPTRMPGSAPASVRTSSAQETSATVSYNPTQTSSSDRQDVLPPNVEHGLGGDVGIAPNSEKTPPNAPRVALNKHCSLLMHDLHAHHLTLTTPWFFRCGLRLSEGERAKTTLTNLGFIESFKVRTGTGRGKTGSAMRLTPAGWGWLGKKPRKSTRGGDSVEHEFFVQHLSRLIPNSSIETLGVDLVIAYNTENHATLHHALEALSGSTIALNTGDLVALEVETCRPTLTAKRNVIKDAGVALTVIATFAKDLASVQQRIPYNACVLLIDVLRLLDALRVEAV